MEAPLLRYSILCLLAGAMLASILPGAVGILEGPNYLLTDNCRAANYEYNTHDAPGSFFFYTGIPDAYCSRHRVKTPLQRFGICGLTGAPGCTLALAPYASKTDACKAMPKTRYYYSDKDCLTSTRVFFNDYDLDCDLVIVCEYFDGTVTTTTTTTPGTPPVAPAPTVVAPPSPSLLPKPGDSVVLSVYAIGAVQYTCNRASGQFANITMVANLYTNPPQNVSIGSYLNANGTQLYSLADGGTAQIGPLDTGASYPQNSTVLLDGGYGSLNKSYSTATGTLSLASVTYVAVTGTVGGVLPNKALCNKANGTLAFIPSFPWTVPYEANITFYGKFAPPV